MLGTQQELGLLRARVLEQAGMTVIFPGSKPEAETVIPTARFDLVLMSHTLSNDAALELAELARQKCPRCPIVLISDSGWHDTKVSPDATVMGNEGPEALIETLHKAQGSKLRRIK